MSPLTYNISFTSRLPILHNVLTLSTLLILLHLSSSSTILTRETLPLIPPLLVISSIINATVSRRVVARHPSAWARFYQSITGETFRTSGNDGNENGRSLVERIRNRDEWAKALKVAGMQVGKWAGVCYCLRETTTEVGVSVLAFAAPSILLPSLLTRTSIFTPLTPLLNLLTPLLIFLPAFTILLSTSSSTIPTFGMGSSLGVGERMADPMEYSTVGGVVLGLVGVGCWILERNGGGGGGVTILDGIKGDGLALFLALPLSLLSLLPNLRSFPLSLPHHTLLPLLILLTLTTSLSAQLSPAYQHLLGTQSELGSGLPVGLKQVVVILGQSAVGLIVMGTSGMETRLGLGMGYAFVAVLVYVIARSGEDDQNEKVQGYSVVEVKDGEDEDSQVVEVLKREGDETPGTAVSPVVSDTTITDIEAGSSRMNLHGSGGWSAWMTLLLVLAISPLVLAIGSLLMTSLVESGGVVAEGFETGVSWKGNGWRRMADYDLAISYYEEDVNTLRNTISEVKSRLPRSGSKKVILYCKSEKHGTVEALRELGREVGADEAVLLRNVGREGETYLQHITRHYDSLTSPLAHKTVFLQPHLAWDWVARPRLDQVHSDTGFISLGPYLNASCTADGSEKDSHGMSFPRIAQIYASFNNDLCPPTGFTITWAGQFVVSRQRILSNPLLAYQNLLGYYDAPKGDDSTDPKSWIWKEGWWNSQPSDPTHGHWLERSWSSVFRCGARSIADCGEGSGPECECLD